MLKSLGLVRQEEIYTHVSVWTPDAKRRATFCVQNWKLLALSTFGTPGPDTWKSVMFWLVSNIQNSKYRYRNQILMESPTTTQKITSENSLLPRSSALPHLNLQVSCTIDLVPVTCFWVCQCCFSYLNYSIYKMGTMDSGYLKCVLKDEKWHCLWKKITK